MQNRTRAARRQPCCTGVAADSRRPAEHHHARQGQHRYRQQWRPVAYCVHATTATGYSYSSTHLCLGTAGHVHGSRSASTRPRWLRPGGCGPRDWEARACTDLGVVWFTTGKVAWNRGALPGVRFCPPGVHLAAWVEVCREAPIQTTPYPQVPTDWEVGLEPLEMCFSQFCQTTRIGRN